MLPARSRVVGQDGLSCRCSVPLWVKGANLGYVPEDALYLHVYPNPGFMSSVALVRNQVGQEIFPAIESHPDLVTGAPELRRRKIQFDSSARARPSISGGIMTISIEVSRHTKINIIGNSFFGEKPFQNYTKKVLDHLAHESLVLIN